MPPERILGKGEDPTSEIYSLGMILYQILTGETYFTDEEIQKMEFRLKGELLTLSKGHSKLEKISTDIAEIVGNMIKRVPGQRYQKFHHVENDIFHALASRF